MVVVVVSLGVVRTTALEATVGVVDEMVLRVHTSARVTLVLLAASKLIVHRGARTSFTDVGAVVVATTGSRFMTAFRGLPTLREALRLVVVV